MRVATLLRRTVAGALIGGTAACALAPAAAGDTTFKGQWVCNDRGAKKPIPGARVQLYERNSTHLPESVVAVEQDKDYTDDQGRFTMTEPDNDSDRFFVRVTLKDRDDVHLRNWYSPFNYYHDSGLLRNNASTKDFGAITVGSNNNSPKCAAWRGVHLAYEEYEDATNSEPPYDELLIRGDAISAGVPYTTHPTINWPSQYPPDVDPGKYGTSTHEFAHSIRHVFDGSAAHFFSDVSRFGYTRQHDACMKTNEGFAFNEGWAEYWANDYAPAPNCQSESPTDYKIEGNVGYALAKLDADCFGVTRRDMVRVLGQNPGAVHSFDEFRNKLTCQSSPGPLVPKAELDPSIVVSAADQRAAARAHLSFFRDLLADDKRDLREARDDARSPARCRERPCFDPLADRIAPAVFEGEMDYARLLIEELDFSDDSNAVARLGDPLSSAFERRTDAIRRDIQRGIAKIGARMFDRALEAGAPVFRVDRSSEMRALLGVLRTRESQLRRAARGGPFPETFLLPYVEQEAVVRGPTLTPGPESSELDLGCPPQGTVQTAFQVAVKLSPPRVGSQVRISYTHTSGSSATQANAANAEGDALDSFTPDKAGEWTVQARFDGDANRAASTSPQCTVIVGDFAP